ncbi:MAG: hypothetical protein ACREH5_07990 [Candidatus Omnitrophota bacterium]
MKKIVLGILLAAFPAGAFALTGKQLEVQVYEKMGVPINSPKYPDSLVFKENQRSTIDIQFFALCNRSDYKIAVGVGAPNRYPWRLAVGGDTGIACLTLFKRKVSTDTLSDMQGFAEVTPDKFGAVSTSQPVFANTRVRDTLVLKIQPTPKTADTLFAEVAFYNKSYLLPIDSVNENPLPYPYENWVSTLTALRLLSNGEYEYRAGQIQALYTEFTQAIALHRKDLIERISDLYVLPAYIREQGGANPK